MDMFENHVHSVIKTTNSQHRTGATLDTILNSHGNLVYIGYKNDWR